MTVSIHTDRTSLDLLDAVPLAVVVHNGTNQPFGAAFPAPAEYDLQITGGTTVYWSSERPSPPPGTSYPPHRREFGPGPTSLVVFDWNAVTAQGWSPLAGTYVARVRLLTDPPTAWTSLRFSFAPPLSPGAVPALKPNAVVTLGGTLDAGHTQLSDASGSVTLARRLPAPSGIPLVVRGYASDRPGGARVFAVQRWAPLGPPPSPAPSASP